MKKVVFISNILPHILSFHLPYLKWFKDQGYEVHIMANAAGAGMPQFCDKIFDLKLNRSPFDFKNLAIIREAKEIITRENYDVVHCHTPMGGVLGRLASSGIRKNGCKVLYTAHGFHFYKGAPIINWLLYFPVERILAKKTDCIITINNEDYMLAKRHFMSDDTSVRKTNGIGVDLDRFQNRTLDSRDELRMQYGIDPDTVVLFYAAEFIPRKNHKLIIKCASRLHKRIPKLRIMFAGKGRIEDELKRLAIEENVDDVVQFLGYRTDIPELLAVSDLLITPSLQEGLPVNVVEGMAAGLPVIASNIRGHNDLIQPGKNGYLFDTHDENGMINYVLKTVSNREKYMEMSLESQRIAKEYSAKVVLEQMRDIYGEFIDE